MKVLLWLFLFVVGKVAAPDPAGRGSFTTREVVVLKENQVWQAGQRRRYHDNRCEVKLQHDGNFIVKRLVAPNPYYQYYRTGWHTSAAGPADGGYQAKLDSHDGSLMVHRKDGTLVYTSNVGDPERLLDLITSPPRDHVLTINEECILDIYRGGVSVWTNNRYGGLTGEAGIGNYLQKGEMFHVNLCYRCADDDGDCLWIPNTLYLQHDCNLVQFRGRDLADRHNRMVLWSSQTSNPNLDDCYLYEDEDKVRLYAGTLDKNLGQFEPRNSTLLWEADDDFKNPCSGGYEVLLKRGGGLLASC